MTLTGREIGGLIALFANSSLSAAAGVGGGAVNVAIFYIAMQYTFREAVIYSLATLLGNYSLQVAINWSKRHPLLPSRPVIYWDVILLLLPAELGGADVGVVLGYVFPDTLLIVFAILILLFTSAVTAMKGWQYYKKESKSKSSSNAGSEVGERTSNPLGSNGTGYGSTDQSAQDGSKVLLSGGYDGTDGRYVGSSSGNNNRTEENTSAMAGDEGGVLSAVTSDVNDDFEDVPLRVPWLAVGVVLGAWMLYAVFYVMLNYVPKCSVEYDVYFVCIYPVLVCEILWGFFYIKNKQDVQIKHGDHLRDAMPQQPQRVQSNNGSNLSEEDSDVEYNDDRSKSMSLRNPDHDEREFLLAQNIYTNPLAPSLTSSTSSFYEADIYPMVKGDIQWGQSVLMPIVVVFFAFCIGITSALLGIGGGELMGPLLLRLRVLPEVSSSTVPVMSLLNTSSSIIHYMTISEYPYEYAAVMTVIGAIGGVTGRFLAGRIVRQTGRPSMLVFFLVGVLVLSVGLFLYELVLDPSDWTFGSICDV